MAKLNKNRCNSVNGESYVVGRAACEQALSDILGIPLATRINGSIFGDVDTDGSWTMLRFTRTSPTSSPTAAVGWEFSDGYRRVRLIQLSSTMRLYYWTGSRWQLKIDFEDEDEDRKLVDLEDVDIEPEDMVAGKVVKVADDGSTFILGADTSTDGADEWKELTDVISPYGGSYGSPGNCWKSNGTSNISPREMPQHTKIACAYTKWDFSLVPDVISYVTNWGQYTNPSGYTNITRSSDGYFNLAVAGIYKITFGWRQRLTGAETNQSDDSVPSQLRLIVDHSANVHNFPRGYYKDELWWYFKDGVAPQPPFERGIAWPLMLGQCPDGNIELYVTSGGDTTAWIRFAMASHVMWGARPMDLSLGIEKVG